MDRKIEVWDVYISECKWILGPIACTHVVKYITKCRARVCVVTPWFESWETRYTLEWFNKWSCYLWKLKPRHKRLFSKQIWENDQQ